MGSRGTVPRRTVLATVGTLAGAGCLGRTGDVAAPSIADPRIESDWHLVDRTRGVADEAAIGPMPVRAHEHRVQYRYEPLHRELTTLFDLEGEAAATFFASRLDLRPGIDGLPFGVGSDRVMATLREATIEAFLEEMRIHGIESIDRTDERTVDTGVQPAGREYRFEAALPIEGTLPYPAGASVPVSASLPLWVILRIWHDGANALVAGGVAPAEPVATAFDIPDSIAGIQEELFAGTAMAAAPSHLQEQIRAFLEATH